MGYHVIDPADIEPEPDRPSEMRYISEAVAMENIGVRVYDVAPGEEIPISGLHYHDQQEEVFYVVDGELSVETPETVYTVSKKQFFVAEPESPHRAYNQSTAESAAEVVAFGAPSVADGHAYEE